MENENELFSFSDDQSKFTIKFDELFEKPKLEVYNQFDVTAKRNFKMIVDLISDTYKDIFLKDGKLKENMDICLLQILNVQSKIMKNESMSVNNFLQLLEQVVSTADGLLLKEIEKFVNDGYALTLDADTKKMKEKHKAVNDQLIISDAYAKVLIQIAYLDRLMIPLISQFFIYNKADFPTKVSVVQSDDDEDSEDLVFNEVNQTIFNRLFELVAKENTENIQNKLYKLVLARLMRTSFYAKRFWTKAEQAGITIESSALEIYSKLLSNSVPKLLLSKELNVVNFFATIINNQIMFLFSNKFKTHYQTVNQTSGTGSMFESNDDNMNELEKMEIRLGHKNEGELIVNNIISKDVISKIDKYMDVMVTKEEIANVLGFIHMNPIQERIVAMMTFKYFKSTDAIKHATAYEYAKLLLCCIKFLEKNKFVLLPKILMSRCIKQRDRTAITGVKIKAKIEDSKRYKELLETKYKDFKTDIERNIQSLISTIYSSSFIDEKGEDAFASSAKIGNVAEEIVDLCFLI